MRRNERRVERSSFAQYYKQQAAAGDGGSDEEMWSEASEAKKRALIDRAPSAKSIASFARSDRSTTRT